VLVLAVASVSAVVAGAIVVSALDTVDEPVTADVPARPVEQFGDVASVFNVGPLDLDLEVAAISAARDAGAAATTGRGASVGMLRVTRGGGVVQQAPDGFRIPMTVTALPPAAIANVMGRDVSGVLGADTVVMGALTASLRGAQAGDHIDLVAADGSVVTMRIARVAPDEQVGGTELVMTYAAADRLGITTPTRVLIWGIGSRAAFDAALAVHGVTGRRETRILRSWDPPNPDSTLGTAETKALLGEFAYQLTGGDGLIQDGGWVAANLPGGRELLNDQIPIRARCHHVVAVDLKTALAEVAAAGLAWTIDVTNANTYGGCHYARFNRINGELGFLSRHSWAMALDTNTVGNCQGCVPKMNCDVVRIFRRHNFAWGGNFLRPDGMHFEWVGERRDQVAGPSKYCPNDGQTTTGTGDAGTPGDTRGSLFADDGRDLSTHEHDH
jgi:D-alanyl-D-alanine carboxypeptidase